MPNLRISVNYRRPFGEASNRFKGIEALRYLVKFLTAIADGSREASGVKFGYNDTVTVQNVLAYAGQAVGLLTFASSSGSVGALIGAAATSVVVTWATSDIVSMTALVAAVKANTTVNPYMTATNKLMKMTVASVAAADVVDVCGSLFTAIANGATAKNDGEFSVGASDTACALNLVTAINRHPNLADQIRAASIAGAVYIGLVDDRTATKWDRLKSTASTITVNTRTPTAGATSMLMATTPGVIGNQVPMAATGTNVTYATNGTAAFLGQGCGGTVPSFTENIVP